MFDSDHYVPILRGKSAEFQALGEATDQIKDGLTPFIEMPPVSWDPEDGSSGVPDPSIVKVAANIARRWDSDRPFFLELGLVPSEASLGGGVHPVEYVFGDLRSKEMQAIPVTSLGRDDAFQVSVREAVAEDERGVCIRLSGEDFDDVRAAVEEVDDLLAQMSIERSDADLLLDFGEVSAEQTGPMTLAGMAVIGSIPGIEEWRTLIWSGNAFPSLQNYEANTINIAPRGEWSIWRSLVSKDLPRHPSFADYTINGVQSDYDVSASFYRSSPNLRYTADEDFVIWKARHPRHGHDQFNDICRSAIARHEFKGSGYSEGDAYVARCAADEDGPGMAVQWRKAGVNHHLAAVVDQIANLPAP
jgi:Beta protein